MKPRCVTVEQFLEPEAVAGLLEFAARQEGAFIPSSAGEGWEHTRQSSVLFDAGPWAEAFRRRIYMLHRWMRDAAGLPEFEVGEIETQITHSGEGAYFHGHSDNGSPDTVSRVLTFVYYFHRQPQAFTGGDLLIYEEPDWHRWRAQPGEYQRVPPVANTVVFFPASVIHEVERVSVPSGAFLDGRFTLNGWLRQRE